MDLLVTGVDSGLGRAVHATLGGVGLARASAREVLEMTSRSGVDAIVHCAHGRAHEVTADELYPYIEDNVQLTRSLVSLPHKRFVYLSSIDVYPASYTPAREDQAIDVSRVRGPYSMSKLISESIVRKHCPGYVIIRSAALLGRTMRRNSLLRIVEDDPCELGLSADSDFNYVLHDDLIAFIRTAVEQGLRGVFNAASSENVTLGRIAEILGKKVSFGRHRYETGRIDNSKIVRFAPAFSQTSEETARTFIESWYEQIG
jgi:nucleoside-diphosphate-sugar epimerase